MADETNGQKHEYVDTLILQFDRRTNMLVFDGDAMEGIKNHKPGAFDVVLNMLSHAHRHIEVQFRILAGIEAQEGLRRQKEEAEVRRRFLGAQA